MRILVTGAAGFIGSAAAARFVREGHDVVALDSFNDYYDPVLKRQRVAALIPSVPLYRLDITNHDALSALFDLHHFDVVAHFAGQAGVRYSVDAPESYVAANVQGMQTLLEVMRQHHVLRMVFASTSSAYGVDTPSPFLETASADKPVSVYAATKRAGELLAHSYFVQYGIQTTCVRFFTVYGPWSRPDMAMLKFAKSIMAGEPIDIYNYGKLRRDFTYIDDIVEGFTLALQKPLGYEIVNLGNGQPIELIRFVEVLEKALGKRTERRLLPMQQGDVFETFANTTKAKELLGFSAKTNFEAGVQAFADWFRDYQKM